jgi:hypothetical protein
MGKKFLFPIICLLSLGCVHHYHLVNESGIEHIDVWRHEPNRAARFKRIDDQGKIQEIIAAINENYQEPAYFYVTSTFYFVYKNRDTTVIGVNNDRIIAKGQTFKIGKAMDDVF